MNHYIVRREEDHILSCLMDDGMNPLDIYRDKETSGLSPGMIFSARVRDVVPAIDAAFVTVGSGEVCFLPLRELRSAIFIHKGNSASLCQGDELLVQVVRRQDGQKAPSVSTDLQIQGYLAVARYKKTSGVSKKIDASRRKELAALAAECSDEECSVLIRTNAESASDEQIVSECRSLMETLHRVIEKGKHSLPGILLYAPPGALLLRIRSLRASQIADIITDDEKMYEEIRTFTASFMPELAGKVVLYQSELQSLENAYRVARAISLAEDKKIWLKSGAFLVIEKTEAMSVIDVNSGKVVFKKREEREKSLLSINLEAAAACAWQIRLRNLSGIIMIDFINMEEEESKKALMEYLEKQLARDPVRTSLIDMTPLGIVEITRRKDELP